MNWARPKLKIGSFYLTACFCTIFSIARCFLFAIARGPARTKKRVFPVNLSISVQPCLTLFSFSSCFSRFLNLFSLLPSQHTTYYIQHTFFKRPPILRANHPILRGSHPILRGSYPI